jgi:hypothetical protein
MVLKFVSNRISITAELGKFPNAGTLGFGTQKDTRTGFVIWQTVYVQRFRIYKYIYYQLEVLSKHINKGK